MPQAPDPASCPQDRGFMQMALQQAEQAAAAGEVPVGAVVVKDGVVIGQGRNSPIGSNDPSAHAEIVALRAAAAALGNYRLEGCTLYVTLEPCAMCSGAMLHSRVKRVVFGAADPKTGCGGSVLNLFSQRQLNHQTQLEGGVLAAEAGQLLADFFQQRRMQQRQLAAPLREDALRTAEQHFAQLPHYPWTPHYLNALPGLSGLRLHYLDEGRAEAAMVYLCLHPVPGWSYSLRHRIPQWVEQGVRVLVPDLIGFGKSDKPKRQDVHSLHFHVQYLQEWLAHLKVPPVVLWVPVPMGPLGAMLAEQASGLVTRVETLALHPPPGDEISRVALDAPYPDAGHRSAERAFADPRFH